jgi:hypothetical protein
LRGWLSGEVFLEESNFVVFLLCVDQFYVLILSVYDWHFFVGIFARFVHRAREEFDFKFVPFDMIGHICDCMLHKDKDVVFKDCYQDHGGYQFEFGYENVQRTKVGEL